VKARNWIVGTALFLLAAPGLADARSTQGSTREPFPATQAAVLRSREDPSLLSFRAGAVPVRGAIGAEEREALRAAEARSQDLGSMRGGSIDLSDHDLKLIAIALVILLVLIII
jgi:hypothetical protein